MSGLPTAVIGCSHITEALRLLHFGTRFYRYKLGLLIKGAISLALALSVLSANPAQPSYMHIGSIDLSAPFKWFIVAFAFVVSFGLCYGFLTLLSRHVRRLTLHKLTDKWEAESGGTMQLVLVEDQISLTFTNGRTMSIPLSSITRIIESPAMVVLVMPQHMIPLPKQADWQKIMTAIKAQHMVKVDKVLY